MTQRCLEHFSCIVFEKRWTVCWKTLASLLLFVMVLSTWSHISGCVQLAVRKCFKIKKCPEVSGDFTMFPVLTLGSWVVVRCYATFQQQRLSLVKTCNDTHLEPITSQISPLHHDNWCVSACNCVCSLPVNWDKYKEINCINSLFLKKIIIIAVKHWLH